MTSVSCAQTSFIVVLAVILCTVSAAGQDTKATLEGVVKDGTKPFSGALLIVTDSESVWQTKTEANGEFHLIVPQGCYELMLSSQYFHAKTKYFCLQSGEVKKLTFRVKKEFGPIS